MAAPQSFANHRRFDPLYHFFLAPLALIALLAAVVSMFRHPSLHQGLLLVGAAAFLMVVVLFRGYAIRVQDRVIRLEETLRLAQLLPEDLKARIPELSVRQCVGLRFAADAEVAERMREALELGLNDEGIKKRIQVWRPDTFRV